MQLIILCGYFINIVLVEGIIGKKKYIYIYIYILCELVTSQPHWFAGSQLDISKFSIVNNFLVYRPICMKFMPNSSVLGNIFILIKFYYFRSFSFNFLFDPKSIDSVWPKWGS